jgi:glycine/D-amino acid oxidase-like deaminating enzyme
MTSKNVIIVGAGLFGSIAARLARDRGHQVTLIDNGEEHAASKASGCVLAPSWLGSLSDKQRKRGMEVLRRLYTVHDVEFQTNVLAKFKAARVDPIEVLLQPDIVGTVMTVANGKVTMRDGCTEKGTVLVAAGIWSGSLVEMPLVSFSQATYPWPKFMHTPRTGRRWRSRSGRDRSGSATVRP